MARKRTARQRNHLGNIVYNVVFYRAMLFSLRTIQQQVFITTTIVNYKWYFTTTGVRSVRKIHDGQHAFTVAVLFLLALKRNCHWTTGRIDRDWRGTIEIRWIFVKRSDIFISKTISDFTSFCTQNLHTTATSIFTCRGVEGGYFDKYL